MIRTMPNEMNADQGRVDDNNQENGDEEHSPTGENESPGNRILKERTLKDFGKA